MVFVWASGRKGRALSGEWDRVRLGVLEERQGWGVGPLANKVSVQPESLAGSTPRPCGHEDLIRILRRWAVKEQCQICQKASEECLHSEKSVS